MLYWTPCVSLCCPFSFEHWVSSESWLLSLILLLVSAHSSCLSPAVIVWIWTQRERLDCGRLPLPTGVTPFPMWVIRGLEFLHAFTDIRFSSFYFGTPLTKALTVNVKWYFIIALVRIIPMTNDVEHLPCMQWPIVHTLWTNINTNTLSVYKLDVFVVELSFFILCISIFYTICKYFLPPYRLPFTLLILCLL